MNMDQELRDGFRAVASVFEAYHAGGPDASKKAMEQLSVKDMYLLTLGIITAQKHGWKLHNFAQVLRWMADKEDSNEHPGS